MTDFSIAISPMTVGQLTSQCQVLVILDNKRPLFCQNETLMRTFSSATAQNGILIVSP